VHGRGELGPADPRLDAPSQLRVAREVVVLKRRLSEEDVAVLDAVEHPEGFAPVAPAVAEVEHHRDLVTEQPPALVDASHHLSVRDEVLEQHLHLHRAEAERERALEASGDVVHHLADRAPAHGSRVDGRIRRDGLPARAAEQLVDGPVELLADEVVQSDVDGRERMDP
jgi:hypothetical protein